MHSEIYGVNHAAHTCMGRFGGFDAICKGKWCRRPTNFDLRCATTPASTSPSCLTEQIEINKILPFCRLSMRWVCVLVFVFAAPFVPSNNDDDDKCAMCVFVRCVNRVCLMSGSVNVCHANEINPISNLNQISIYVERVSFGSGITTTHHQQQRPIIK